MSPFSWSVPLFRVAGIAVRAHWTLFAMLAYDFYAHPHVGFGMWAFMAVALFGSVLLHEFGHALAARAIGGDCRRIELWMLGGLAHCEVPMRPWPQFATSAAGPLVTAVIAAAAYGALALSETGGPLFERPMLLAGIQYLGVLNLRMLIFNLLPVQPLDGGSMFRALLWPLMGLRRATMVTLYLSYPAAIAVLLWAGLHGDVLFSTLGVWMIFQIVQEHTLLRLGQLDEESWRGGATRSDGWWTRWRRERARRAQEQRERAEQEEQDLVDRLLAKVGETGLASLSKPERATLEAYSRKQREKQEIGGR